MAGDCEPILVDLRVDALASKSRIARGQSLWHLQRVLIRLGVGRAAQLIQVRDSAELPPMNADTGRWLVQKVSYEENLILAELIGRDLGRWNAIEPA